MSCDSGAKTGAEVAIRFAIGCPADDPTSLTFKELGMCRSKSFDTSIDTIDVTADKSSSSRRLFIPSFKTDTISVDGVSYQDVIYNQKELRNHIKFGDPLGPTAGKPFLWVEITHPVYGQIEQYPVIASSWGDTGTYDDAVQWSCEFSSAGAPVVTQVS
tara:strand:- start:3951 stop:4427 length:477 start_codon:yes stop_codon:yes gene_type:complete